MTHPGFKAALRRQIRQLDAAEEADALAFIAAVAEEPTR
jgi:predicted RNA polymerase sigma factor